MPSYQKNDEWQLITISVAADAKIKGQAGDWWQFLVYIDEMYKHHNMPIYIQWAGAFKNVASAQKYFDEDMGNAGGNEEDEGPDGSEDTIPAPTEVFWDLSSKKVIKNQVEVAGDTVVSFDTEMDAMKVVASDVNKDGAVGDTPGRFSLGTRVPLAEGLNVEEYSYIAMRVRLNKASLEGGSLYVTSTGTIQNYQDGVLSSANLQVGVLDYDPNTDWQTVVINFKDNMTASFFLTGDWMSMTLNLFGGSVLSGDAAWLRWAGAFKSEADITDYVAATKHQEQTIDVGDGGQVPGDDEDTSDKVEGDTDTESDDQTTPDSNDQTSPDTGDTNAVVLALLLAVLAVATMTTIRVIAGKKVSE